MVSVVKVFIYCILLITSFSTALYAERAAIFFIEFNHADQNKQSNSEFAIVYMTNLFLQSSYRKFYWLINTSATKDNFIETIQIATNKFSTVDIYIIAHGGMQYFWGHYDERIYVDDILSLGSLDNSDHLRFVYIGSCHGWDLTDEFIEAGAISATGCKMTLSNFPIYPVFIYLFGQLDYSLKKVVRITSLIITQQLSLNGIQNTKMRSD